MRGLFALVGLLAVLGRPLPALPQEERSSESYSSEDRLRMRAWENLKNPPVDRSPDLWYGQPGVRPGGDLIVPVLDLIRQPSGLLDFRPRKVPSWLPDRETLEFLRERY